MKNKMSHHRTSYYMKELSVVMLLSIMLYLLGSVVAMGNATDALSIDEWDLSYSAEFDDIDEIDQFDTQFIWNRSTIINNEQQYYLDPKLKSPFTISGSVLSIVAEPTPESLLPEVFNQPYTSGLLTSRSNSHSQTYGLWEIRAKLPAARGAWPAFWLLPTFKNWPKGVAVLSEIDILEGIEGVKEGQYRASWHTNQNGELKSVSEKIHTGTDLTGEFHRYAVAWSEDYLIWYFDGREVYRVATPDDMHSPRHFLVNLAVGGWAGTPVAEDYPANFEVDYLRVYTRKPVSQSTHFTFEAFIRILEHLRDVARSDKE